MEIRRHEGELAELKDDRVFTWPNLVVKEFLAAILVTVGILFYSFYVDAPLSELADPAMMIHFWRIRKDGGISGRL